MADTTKTVGNGGNYPNWMTAISSIVPDIVPDIHTPLGTNLRYIQISDTIENGAAMTNSGVYTNGFKITLESSNPHRGKWNEGWISYWQPTGPSQIVFTTWANHEIKDLNFKWLNGNFLGVATTTGKNGNDVGSLWVETGLIHDNLFDMAGYNNNIAIRIYPGGAKTDPYISIWNNKIYRCNERGIYYAGSATKAWIENNSIYAPASALTGIEAGGFNALLRNNAVCVDAAGDCFVFTGANCEAYGNMSTDDTADDAAIQSNNNINAIFADQFESLDPNHPGFLKPLSGAIASGGGVRPAAISRAGAPMNVAGIAGHQRPHRT